jgi:hypothetical protein
MAKCPKCGYDESNNKQLQASARERQKKDKEIVEKMVGTLIPPPKTPRVHFSGSSFTKAAGISAPARVWAFASTDINQVAFETRL